MSSRSEQVEEWSRAFDDLKETDERLTFEEYDEIFSEDFIVSTAQDARENNYGKDDILEVSYGDGSEALDRKRRIAEFSDNLSKFRSAYKKIPGFRKDRLGEWAKQKGYEEIQDVEIEGFEDIDQQRSNNEGFDAYSASGSALTVGGILGSFALPPLLQPIGIMGSGLTGVSMLHIGAMKSQGKEQGLNEIEYEMLTDNIDLEAYVEVK